MYLFLFLWSLLHSVPKTLFEVTCHFSSQEIIHDMLIRVFLFLVVIPVMISCSVSCRIQLGEEKFWHCFFFLFFTDWTLNHKDSNPHPHYTSCSRWFTIRLVSGMKDTSRRDFSLLKEMVGQGGDSKMCFLQLEIWCWSSYSAGHQVHSHAHTHTLP